MSNFDDYDSVDTDWDGFEEEEEYLEENFYKIGNYSGKCLFWEKTHELSELYSALFNLLVPVSGVASTKHGELLRMVSRLMYDIFNNGLCNDKKEECRYLLDIDNLSDYRIYLKEKNSVDIIKTLLDCQERDFLVDLNEVKCSQLDDIVQAIIKVNLYELSKQL